MKAHCSLSTLAASIISTCLAAATVHAQETLFSGKFVPCSRSICGGFPQNVAALSLCSSDVEVSDDGSVRITLIDTRVIETGEIAANFRLAVFFGSFVPGSYSVQFLGYIVTDRNGNFDGPIDAGGGVPFVFPQGATVAGNFILNSYGSVPRSEFITGIAIPRRMDPNSGAQ